MPANFMGFDSRQEPLVETALYYPYMTAPKSTWFTQVLLYWDDVATIVPDAHEHAASPETRDFVQAGLLRRMSPDEAVYGVNGDQFASKFLETALPWTSTDIPSFTEIHGGKMSYSLFEELKAMGLAQRAEGRRRGIWYRVEKTTASAFMAYLAGVMSGLTPGVTPVTDSVNHVAALAPSGQSKKQKLEALRYVAITEALPTPAGPVNANDLARFKDRYRDELKRCRDYLDLQLISLARANDDDDLAEHELTLRIADLRHEANELQAELHMRMRQRGWMGFSKANFGAIASTGLQSVSAMVSGGSALVTGMALGVAMLSLVDPARAFLNHRASPDSGSPLLYAALATKLPSDSLRV